MFNTLPEVFSKLSPGTFLKVLCTLLVPSLSPTSSFAKLEDIDQAIRAEISALEGTRWTVERINDRRVLEDAKPVFEFGEEMKIAGTSGCNRFFGTMELTNGVISFKGVGSTRMACPGESMQQEHRFFDTLAALTRLSRPGENLLILSNDSGEKRLALILADPDGSAEAVATEQPLDIPSDSSSYFECEDEGTVTVRFLGPDTVELMAQGEKYILQLQHSASGARYASEHAEFWNKGGEALLQLGEGRSSCLRNSN